MRELDYDLLALKLAVIAPDMYAMMSSFEPDAYIDEIENGSGNVIPNWIVIFEEGQDALGIFPLTYREARKLLLAVRRLMGCL